MKKLVLFIMVVTMCLTGCKTGNRSEEDLGNDNYVLDLATATPEENTLPVSKNGVKLTFGSDITPSSSGKIIPLGDMRCFKELQERTGVEIEFLNIPEEKINLLFASDDLPDIMWFSWGTLGGSEKYYQDGQIINLDEYIAKYAPNLVQVLKDYDGFQAQLADVDGHIRYFPFIRPEKESRVFQGFQIRQDWLDKLNLSMPTSREEFENVLRAFKEQDPNGNGIQDEVPFAFSRSYGIDRLYNFYGKSNFYVEDGKVKCGWLDPEYKDFLQWVRGLYEQGLIDADFSIKDNARFENMVTTGRTGAWYGLASGTLSKLTTLMSSVDKNFKISAMPWLESENGIKYSIDSEAVTAVTENGAAISSQCSNIEVAVKVLDYLYSKDGQLLQNFGIEGESYTIVDGKPKYTDEILHNPKGLPIKDALMNYCMPANCLSLQMQEYFDQTMDSAAKKAISVWTDVDYSRSVPLLKYSDAESDITVKKFNEINSYQSEFSTKLIVGKESFDNYDKFIQTMKDMGLEDVVAVRQTAYERFLNY